MIKKLYNPDASATNTLVLYASESGCCNGELTTCKYTVAYTDGQAITGITIDGTLYSFASVTAKKDIRRSLATALKEAGYAAYAESNFNSFVFDAGGLHLIGEAPIDSVTIAGSPVSAVVLCVTGRVCQYSAVIDLDPALTTFTLTINGEALVATEVSVGTGAALAAEVIDLLAGSDIDYYKVSGSGTGANSTITIDLVAPSTVSLGDVDFTECCCYIDFVSA